MEFIEKALKVKLTFIEEVLGLSPASKEVYRDYIASKAPDAPTVADEIEAVGVDETTRNCRERTRMEVELYRLALKRNCEAIMRNAQRRKSRVRKSREAE
nr:MAG TPA: hypothetical protein [Caudoviricetes sp.]